VRGVMRSASVIAYSIAIFFPRSSSRSWLSEPVGFEVGAISAVDRDHSLAEHAVEVLERAFDTNRRAPAVALAENLAVDVISRHFDRRLLHFEASEIRDLKLRRNFDFNAEREILAARDFGDHLAVDWTGFGDRAKLVLFDRAAVGLAHELLTRLLRDSAAEALLDERARSLALAEAWHRRFHRERSERSLEAAVYRGSGHAQFDLLGAGSGFGDGDLDVEL
jgi:hypothetical protein